MEIHTVNMEEYGEGRFYQKLKVTLSYPMLGKAKTILQKKKKKVLN